MKNWLGPIILATLCDIATSSIGDQSPFYQRCLESCSLFNCTDDGINFKISTYQQPLMLYLTLWNCEDECKYDCMWKTIEVFHQRNWRTPQFYGKWPFIRIFGMQEPASVLFSLLNGFVHIYMIKKFRKKVRPDSPLIWLWHVFFIVGVNTWIWSAIFHTRDLPITELLDYVSAFSLVLMSFYMMIVRLLREKISGFVLITITVFLITFFINHVIYLSAKFDYGYNMQVNIFVGTFTAICWFGWSIYNRSRQPYVIKCAMYVVLTGIIILLEVADSPPFFYIIDFHSLWHLFTAPLTVIFYSFGIDDCKYLRKQQTEPVNKSYEKVL